MEPASGAAPGKGVEGAWGSTWAFLYFKELDGWSCNICQQGQGHEQDGLARLGAGFKSASVLKVHDVKSGMEATG